MSLTIAGFELNRRKLIALSLVVIACIGIALLYHLIDVAALHRHAQALNGPLVFILLVVLPVLGFPMSVASAVAGVRFGLELGLALTSIAAVLHLLASYALVKAAPKFFARRLASVRRRLPPAAHTPLTQFTMLLPGVPYFAKNYVLPLAGVPLGTYLLWSIPINIARSLVGIIFGDMSGHLTAARVAGFAAYVIFITVACGWALRRLQAKMRDRPPAADGRKQRG